MATMFKFLIVNQVLEVLKVTRSYFEFSRILILWNIYLYEKNNKTIISKDWNFKFIKQIK